MRIHCIQWHDPLQGWAAGDVIDIDYQCSADCMFATMAEADIDVSDLALAGTIPGRCSFGGLPGGSETDHDVYCSNCEQLLWRGLQSETEDRVELAINGAVEDAYVAGFEDGWVRSRAYCCRTSRQFDPEDRLLAQIHASAWREAHGN